MKTDDAPTDPIAVAVRAELDRRETSIRATAEAADTSTPVISRWLKGERSIYLNTLVRVLGVLDLELKVIKKKG